MLSTQQMAGVKKDSQKPTVTKTPQQDHIERLFKAYNNDERSTHSLANLLNTLIYTGLSGSLKYLFEALQNADDAEITSQSPSPAMGAATAAAVSATQPSAKNMPTKNEVTPEHQPIKIEFIYQPPYLIIRHNGKHFDENDVEKIADVAALPKQEKSSDPNKTGYKGLGFKALFSIADFIAIFSNGYHFRFDKSAWPNAKTRPWQVIPIATEINEIDAKVKAHIIDSEINIILRLNSGVNLQEEMSYLLKNPHVMLFLRRVNQINISNDKQVSKLTQTVEKIPNTPFTQKKFYVNGKLTNSWITSGISVSKAPIKAALQSLDATVCPDRIKKEDSTVITYAACLEGGNIIESKETVLFATLPSRELCGLPYFVNGEFLLNPDRTQLNENIWNIFLLEQVAFHQFTWLRQLAEYPATRNSILNIISGPAINLFWIKLKEAYAKGFANGAAVTAWIPAYSSPTNYLKIGQCIVDTIEFFKQIKVEDNIVNQLVAYGLANVDRLCTLKFAQEFTYSAFLAKLSDLIKASREQDFNYRVLKFLHEMWKSNRKIEPEIKNTPCLLTQSGKIARPNPEDAYLPSRHNEDIPAIFGIDVVKSEVLGQDQTIQSWLKKTLGAREASRIDIIQTKVFDWIEHNKITLVNAVDVLRFVFAAFKARQLTDEDFKTLIHIKMINQEGKLVTPRECYLADVYEPEVKLEQSGLPKAFFIFAKYHENVADLPLWNQFLIRLGVAPAIKVRFKPWYQRGDAIYENGDLLQHYFDFLKENKCPKTLAGNVDTHQLKNFVDINFIKYLPNPVYALIFWGLIIQQWEAIERCADDTAYHATYQRRTDTYPIMPFLTYYLTNNKCIKASDGKSYESSNLFSPQLNDVITDVFPTVAFPEQITIKQARYLGFKTNLTADEIIKLLDHYRRFSERAKPRCYEIIFIHILQLGASEKDKINARRLSISVLAENGSLQPAVRLHYYHSEQFKSLPDSADYFKLLPGFKHEEMLELCRIFGINLIQGKKAEVSYKQEDAISEIFLPEFLRTILPIIAIQESHLTSRDAQTILRELLLLVNQLQCFSVKKLAVRYPSQTSSNEVTHYFDQDSKTLFYAGRWNKSSAKYMILDEIKHYLQIRSDMREIFKIKQDYQITEWLRYHRFDKEKYAQLKEIVRTTSKAAAIPASAPASLDDTFSSQDASTSGVAEVGNLLGDLNLTGAESPNKPPATPSTKKDAASDPKPATPIAPVDPIGKILDTPTGDGEDSQQGEAAKPPAGEIPVTPPKTPAAPKGTPSPQDVSPFLIKKPAKPAASPTPEQAPRFTPECTPDGAALTQFGFFKPDLHKSPNKTGKTPKAKDTTKKTGRTPNSKLSDSDKTKIGEWSEEFVYKKIMMERYKAKYSTSDREATIDETSTGFTLKGIKKSKDGTTIVGPISLEIIWNNKNGESRLPVDFIIKKGTKEKYIEVKGTKSSDKRSFEISANEVALMKEKKDRYRIYRLFNAGKKEGVRVEKIKNPCAEVDSGNIEMTPAVYKMEYCKK